MPATTSDVVHYCKPTGMWHAPCGVYLAKARTSDWTAVTCPECLAIGVEESFEEHTVPEDAHDEA